MEILSVEHTLLALRITAFASALFFCFYYMREWRPAWFCFFVVHVIHLGFIFWLGIYWHYPFKIFGAAFGGSGYFLLFLLTAAEITRPGYIQRFALALHYLWIIFMATFALQFFTALAKGEWRIHSLAGITVMLAGLALRWHKKFYSRPK